MPPANWAIQYSTASIRLTRPATRAPIVTAGFTWQPLIGPITTTSAMRIRPNVSAVAIIPAAVLYPARRNPKLSVAAPTPKNTSNAVPSNSAMNFRIIWLTGLALPHTNHK
jgi:hypothetical protein